MSQDEYSTYEAKARFSELLRLVREGRTVTVTYHGTPVAEIRPVERGDGTDARVEWLRGRGVIQEQGRKRRLRVLARKPGALERFLAERDE